MAVISEAIFSYRAGKTLMHTFPAILKLIFLFLISVATFFGGNADTIEEILSFSVILRTSICFFLSFLMFLFSGAKWSSIKKLSFVFVLGAMVTFLRAIKIPESEVTHFVEYLNVDGLAFGVLYTIRFFITSLAALTVFETTSPLQIKDALKNAEILSLAINFIPEIFHTWKKIKAASFSRTLHKKNGRAKISIFRAICILFQELEALISCSLYRAEMKRMALENRSNA